MNRNGWIAVCVLLFCQAGCITKLKPKSPIAIQRVEPKHGLLLVNIVTNVQLTELSLNGVANIRIVEEDLKDGGYLLLELPAGAYELSQFKWKVVAYRVMRGSKTEDVFMYYRYKPETNEYAHWDFVVKPHVTNYLGDLLIGFDSAGQYLKVVMANRSSFALQYLEDKGSGFWRSLPIRYAGYGEDRFLQRVSKRRSRRVSP